MSPMPPKMCVACDTVALRCLPGRELEVLLVERRHDPFQGCWALPGGFVEENEDLPAAAARELEEETGLRPVVLEEFGAWGMPGRDPRGRTVSIVYLGVARPGADSVRGMDDAASARWHPLANLPPLAFDHAEIVPSALRQVRLRCMTTHLAFAFLGEVFQGCDLAHVLSALGAGTAHTAADRLLAVADVEPTAEGSYRLTKADYNAFLGEPVFLFAVTAD